MSLFEERVEAGARVLRERLFPGVDLPLGDSAWVGHAREVLLAADAVVTERDDALAAIERVRAVLAKWEAQQEHNREILGSGGLGHFQAIDCTGDLRAALDGAPKPEGRWEYRGRLQSCGYVAEGYISAEHAMNGLRAELEDHPYLVMDDTAIVERARVREWLPVEGETSE